MEHKIKKTVAFELDGKLYASEGEALRALKHKQQGALKRTLMDMQAIMGKGGDFEIERAADLENGLRQLGYELSVMFDILGFPRGDLK